MDPAIDWRIKPPDAEMLAIQIKFGGKAIEQNLLVE